jgi:hypothetical protein
VLPIIFKSSLVISTIGCTLGISFIGVAHILAPFNTSANNMLYAVAQYQVLFIAARTIVPRH